MKKSMFIFLIIMTGLFSQTVFADTLYLLDGSYAEFETSVAKKLLQGAGWYREPMVRMENERKTQRKIVPIEESYTLTGFTKINSIPLLDKNCNVIYAESKDDSTYKDESLRPLVDPRSKQKTTKKKRLYTADRRLAVEVMPSWVDSYTQKGWYLPVTIYYPDGSTEEVLDFEVDAAVKSGGYTEPVMYVYKKDGESKLIFSRDFPKAEAEGFAKSKYITAYSSDGYTQIMTEDEVKASDKWYPFRVITLYHVDGRSAVIAESEKEKYLSDDWYTAPMRYVYAADLRCKLVSLSEIPAWEAVGWYSYPVMTVYAEDGRTRVIPIDEFEAWYKVGWYQAPVVRMFSAYNPSVVVPKTDTAQWEAAGWSFVPMKLIYSIYGERVAVPASEVQYWKEQGWYDSSEEMTYAKIYMKYSEFMNAEDYFNAFMYIKNILASPDEDTKILLGTVYEQYLYRLKASAMDTLRTYYGAPVLTYAGDDFYDSVEPLSEVYAVNLSYSNTQSIKLYCKFDDIHERGETIYKEYDRKTVALAPGQECVIYVSRKDLPASYILTGAVPVYIRFDNYEIWEY